MKRIYCIERWWQDHEPCRDGWWGMRDWETCKIGKYSFVTEYEDEEEFKKDLFADIDNCEIISEVFIKEVPDNYIPTIKL